MLKQQHQFFVGLLALTDGAVVTAAAFAAWGIRRLVIEHKWLPHSWEEYPKEALALYAVPIVLLSLRGFGLYQPRRDQSMTGEVVQIFKASIAAVLAILAMAYLFDATVFRSVESTRGAVMVWGRELDAGRVQLGSLMMLLPVMLAAERVAFRALLRVLRRRGWNLRHVAVIGCGRLGQIVSRTIERNSWTGIKISYFISHQEKTRRTECAGRPVMGGLGELDEILTREKPDAVYVALPSSRASQMGEILGRLDKHPVDVRIVPDLNPRYVPQSMTVSELDGMPILSYRECPTSGVGGVSKRVLDMAGALAALIIFSPVMLLVAALVRLSGPRGGDGGGPVIFKQRRVSLGGEVFDIYKFRTMYSVGDERGGGEGSRDRGIKGVVGGEQGIEGGGCGERARDGLDRARRPADHADRAVAAADESG